MERANLFIVVKVVSWPSTQQPNQVHSFLHKNSHYYDLILTLVLQNLHIFLSNAFACEIINFFFVCFFNIIFHFGLKSSIHQIKQTTTTHFKKHCQIIWFESFGCHINIFGGAP